MQTFFQLWDGLSFPSLLRHLQSCRREFWLAWERCWLFLRWSRRNLRTVIHRIQTLHDKSSPFWQHLEPSDHKLKEQENHGPLISVFHVYGCLCFTKIDHCHCSNFWTKRLPGCLARQTCTDKIVAPALCVLHSLLPLDMAKQATSLDRTLD